MRRRGGVRRRARAGGLLLGNATLYSFVRISHQLKFLPADLVTRLTLTQHRALLPLPDPERKQALARRALDEG